MLEIQKSATPVPPTTDRGSVEVEKIAPQFLAPETDAPTVETFQPQSQQQVSAEGTSVAREIIKPQVLNATESESEGEEQNSLQKIPAEEPPSELEVVPALIPSSLPDEDKQTQDNGEQTFETSSVENPQPVPTQSVLVKEVEREDPSSDIQ